MMQGAVKVTAVGEREVLMTRVFDAPRALVFTALTDPALVQRWLLGPPGWAMVVCRIDLRVGGSFRYEWKHQDGRTLGMSGVYREIQPPEKTVHLESMDGFPGESLVTGTLHEEGGKTTVTTTVVFASRASRDTMLQSGMERGVAASYQRLDDVLASMKSTPGA